MDQTFTRDMLIKYLYQETSAAESLVIHEALQDNILLREEYQDLRNAYDQLPKVKFNAKASTLQNILQYSKHSTALQGQD